MPERPQLAEGIRLAGQMKESAFKEPPWLIEREGAGYVQVTDLLYRIAEQCTGENDYAAIAAKLTTAGIPVRPDTIQRLVAQMLIPLGLVAAADGTTVPVSRARSSLLSINMRMKMVSPQLIDPVTRVFQVLYWPPIMIAVLATAVLTQGWIFAVHGIGAGVRSVLYEPGLLLIAVACSVVSAAFHEVGHAAALRYAGARAKTMGAGLYLIYPAFYTDVSDNYRLGRWARVRTDLGGFYFNLIFALATTVLYFATRQEFLLVLVVLADFEIVYQLQPFMRLDGYWALADLTGIPDFFSQMGAFWRSVLPLPRWRGQKLPQMKWWGKLVFILYTVITIPLLALVLFMMVKSVPRVLATAWDSFVKLATQLHTAQLHGDILTLAAAAVQIIVLAIPTFGMLFLLYLLAKRYETTLWRWGSPTPIRRAASMLGCAAIVPALAYLWAPQLPRILTGSTNGSLAQTTSFRPIAPTEGGTIGDGVAAVPYVGQRVASWLPAAPRTNTAPAAPVAPAHTVATGVTATPAATRAPTAAPGEAVGATPAASPTTSAGASATPMPVATRGSGSVAPGAQPAATATSVAATGSSPAATASATATRVATPAASPTPTRTLTPTPTP